MNKKIKTYLLKKSKEIKPSGQNSSFDDLMGNCGSVVFSNPAFHKLNKLNECIAFTLHAIQVMIDEGFNTGIMSLSIGLKTDQINKTGAENLSKCGWKVFLTTRSSRHHKTGSKRRIKYFTLSLSKEDKISFGKIFGYSAKKASYPDGANEFYDENDDYDYDNWHY